MEYIYNGRKYLDEKYGFLFRFIPMLFCLGVMAMFLWGCADQNNGANGTQGVVAPQYLYPSGSVGSTSVFTGGLSILDQTGYQNFLRDNGSAAGISCDQHNGYWLWTTGFNPTQCSSYSSSGQLQLNLPLVANGQGVAYLTPANSPMPLTIPMFYQPFNNSAGFSLAANGMVNTYGYSAQNATGGIVIEVDTGNPSSASLSARVKYRGGVFATVLLTRVQ